MKRTLLLAITCFFVAVATQAQTTTTAADTSKKKEVAQPLPVTAKNGKITLTGYSTIRFSNTLDDKKTPNTTDIRSARLGVSGSPLKNFDYKLVTDFAPPSVRIIDATGSYSFKPWLKLTAGQQKIPLTYESYVISDYDVHSINRSQVVEALVGRAKDVISNNLTGNNNGRDIGVWLNGSVPNAKTKANWVEAQLAVVNGNGIGKADNDTRKDVVGRVVVYPIKQLSIGGSFYSGHATYGIDLTEPKVRTRFGVEAVYKSDRVMAAAEYLSGTDSVTDKSGYYAQVEGFVVPKKFGVLVKYDFYDPNNDKKDDASTAYIFGLNYYFAPYTKIQVEYDAKKEEGGDDLQKDNDIFYIQAQILF